MTCRCRGTWQICAEHKVRPVYECQRCGVSYTPTRSKQKYCSTRCRNAANWRSATVDAEAALAELRAAVDLPA